MGHYNFVQTLYGLDPVETALRNLRNGLAALVTVDVTGENYDYHRYSIALKTLGTFPYYSALYNLHLKNKQDINLDGDEYNSRRKNEQTFPQYLDSRESETTPKETLEIYVAIVQST
ncbi:hypothetical protein CDAR_64661 [Caerostris darwini]|uniref:Uncharacterized protein n=1 Tax=Caerostris darwini TaxID=1538125 RepID=A0AAV4V411_9ARAC|nr:hypothetical protein CDAR_64661 [Caerostris darwini]